MSHHCIDWIPSELVSQINLIWTLDLEVPNYNLPKVWVEHGIPDTHVLGKEQFHDDIYYLCSNSWTYKGLKAKGLKAFHTGHVFLDKTIPYSQSRHLFVYAPQHCSFENKKWQVEPLTKKELEDLTKKYECAAYITSVVDDTNTEAYKDLNMISSDRFKNMGNDHFYKCKSLYQLTKVIYTDIMSTFDIVGESHGIKILGRENQKKPREYDNIKILNDGKSCERILDKIKEIIRDHNEVS